MDESGFIRRCAKRLETAWQEKAKQQSGSQAVDPQIAADVDTLVNAKTMTYRYMVVTQVLAKCVDRQLNATCLQASAQMTGAFDARSLCDEVVVPFDRANNKVLGGSDEPYVSKPARVPAISTAVRASQKRAAEYDALIRVVEHVNAHPESADAVLFAAMVAIRRRMEITHVVYPVPNRIAQAACVDLVERFLREKSGGARAQAVSLALFRCLAERTDLWKSARSNPTNAADSQTGSVADIECLDVAGQIVLAIEVKDRELTIGHVTSKLAAVRAGVVRELLFLVRRGVSVADEDSLKQRIAAEFSSGQNIHVSELKSFMAMVLTIVGEDGRRTFLQLVGDALAEMNARVDDRIAWRDLLSLA